MRYNCLMTVAAYVSPNLFPAIIADTLVSFEHDRSLGSRILPSTFIGEVNKDRNKFAIMARKIYFFERMALGISGNVSQIKNFLSEARSVYKIVLENERPMRVISRIANEYKEISTIGVISLDWGNSVLTHGESFKLPNLGDCWVVGSGRDEFSLRLEAWDQQFSSLDCSSIADSLNGLSCSLTSFNAITEMRSDLGVRSWGGVYECGLFDFHSTRWRYGSSCLHITALAIEVAFDNFTIALSSRFICYEPGKTHGLVRSIESHTGSSVTWLLEDVTSPFGEGAVSDADDILRKWQPQMICITFLPPKGRTLKIPTMFVSVNRIKGFKFQCRDGFEMIIPDAEWDRICTEICDQWQVSYRPRFFERGSIW
jgi:hypothetical protein